MPGDVVSCLPLLVIDGYILTDCLCLQLWHPGNRDARKHTSHLPSFVTSGPVLKRVLAITGDGLTVVVQPG